MAGVNFVTRQADGSRRPVEAALFIQVIMPIVAGFVFIIAIFTTSGYLMQAVVEEKENRTMEILLTSLSPGQLITGKIIGISAVGLTQILVWGGLAILIIVMGRSTIEWLQYVRLEPAFWLLLGSPCYRLTFWWPP